MDIEKIRCSKCNQVTEHHVELERAQDGYCPFFHHDTGLCGCSEIGGSPEYKDSPCPGPSAVHFVCKICASNAN